MTAMLVDCSEDAETFHKLKRKELAAWCSKAGRLVLGMIGSNVVHRRLGRAMIPLQHLSSELSQEQLVSPLRRRGYFEPSKSMTYRRSRVFEQTGLMIGQQLDNAPPITKRDAQAAWKGN